MNQLNPKREFRKQFTMRVHRLRERVLAMHARDSKVFYRIRNNNIFAVSTVDHDEVIACYLEPGKEPMTGAEFTARLWEVPNLPMYFCFPHPSVVMWTVELSAYLPGHIIISGEKLALGEYR